MAPQHLAVARAFGLVVALGVACGPVVGPRPTPSWGSAERALEARCQQGVAAACGELGRVLVDRNGKSGTGEKGHDFDRGLVLLEIACGQQDVLSCTWLGRVYSGADNGAESIARGRDMLSWGCAQGSASACAGLGRIVVGTEEDAGQAKRLFRTACELGDAEGCEGLGGIENDPFGGDRARAREAFTKACRLGRLSACHQLALTELADPATDAGAITLLKGACNRGFAPSCVTLALRFAPTAAAEEDCTQATPLAERACRAGERTGCAIANACSFADSETRGKAVELLRKDCARRIGIACLYWADAEVDRKGEFARLRSAYEIACADTAVPVIRSIACGRLGGLELGLAATTSSAAERAVHLLRQACDESSGQACCDLAEAYRAGTGVAVSPSQASDLRARACKLKERRCCASLPAGK